MSDPAVIEAAARAAKLLPRLEQIAGHDWRISFLAHTSDTAHEAAQLIRELLKIHIPPDFYTPLIRAAALEECAVTLKEAELQIEYLHERFGRTSSGEAVLARIRALKEQP